MKGLWKKVSEFWNNESGQGMVEYILIIGLIVIFIVGVLFIFRDKVKEFIHKVADWIGEQNATPGD